MHHIYICVFPCNDKTYAIIAWVKQYDNLFLSIKEKLLSLTEKEKKNYINHTLPHITENIVVKPSSWDKLSENAKDEFGMLIWGMADLMEHEGIPFDRFSEPSFDLFSL